MAVMEKEDRTIRPREEEVLPFLARWASDAQIARALDITESTVHSHRCNMTRKLNIHNRTDLVRSAQEHGF